jgi:predicted deacylase
VANEIIYNAEQLDWNSPGKRHYDVAFHLDSSWGYSLVRVTVINGLRQSSAGKQHGGVAVFGGTHGNEWEGQIAVKRLCHDLEPDQVSGRVILIPQLSVSACTENSRLSPRDGVNMNRAFPGNAYGTISYRIAHFVKSRVFPLVRVVVDLHSGGVEGGFALCTSIHGVADPKQYQEMVMAASLFDTPFVFIYSSQMASGLLTSEAETEGKIAIGGEFGYGESVNRRGVLHAYEGVKNLLRFYGHLKGAIQKIDPSRATKPCLVSAPELESYVPAPCDGIWEPSMDLGEHIREGGVIGYLHDFSDYERKPMAILAPHEGIVIMMHGPAKCNRGVTLYVVAREISSPNCENSSQSPECSIV